MDDSADESGQTAPAWLLQGKTTLEDQRKVCAFWNQQQHAPLRVTADRLDELLTGRWRPMTNMQYSVEGVGDRPTGKNQDAVRLRRELHDQAVELLGEEHEEELREVGRLGTTTYSWREERGFPLLIAYLRKVAELSGKNLSDFTVEGAPTRRMQRIVDGEVTTEDGADLEDHGVTLHDEVMEALTVDLNVIVEGVAGTGKSYLLDQLREKYGERIELVVFHPSTSYEEFVSGLRPDLNGGFRGEAGVFVDCCRTAAEDPTNPYLLFIDEINRANTSRVFGDLMLPLEDSKRVHFEESGKALTKDRPQDCVSVRLQTPVTEIGDDGDISELRYLVVPDNLHVLGTMNSSDRSVGTIDLALRRRFTWKTATPLTSEELCEIPAFDKKYREVEEDWNWLLDWYDAVNGYLEDVLGPDALLGHSYFLKEKADADAVEKLLVRQILEIVYMFNISERDLAEMPPRKYEGRDRVIVLKGSGLGRRPQEAWAESASGDGDDADAVS